MESRMILPQSQRVNEALIDTEFAWNGSKERFDELMMKVTLYERALLEIEKSYYKWRLTNTKEFSKYFNWKRAKTGMYASYGKLTFFSFLDMLKKYAKVLPQAEIFYEEQRLKKLAEIEKRNT
jgi:hypothetical protein